MYRTYLLAISNWKKVPKKGDENISSASLYISWSLLKESPQERGRKPSDEEDNMESSFSIERKSPRKGTKTLQAAKIANAGGLQ